MNRTKPPIMLIATAAVLIVSMNLLCAGTARSDSPPLYNITRTVALGAPDRWDYVVFDGSSHHVFVAHGDQVAVVDGRDGTIVGKVEGLPGGTHGIAISAGTGKGYTDDGRAGIAASFDLKTFKMDNKIKAEEDADAVVFDPYSGHVFVIDGDSGKVTVIDPKSDAAVSTINVGSKLEFAVADGRGKLFVNDVAKNEIVRVDTKSNTVDVHWPLSNCTRPVGLAIDTSTHRLFSSCRGGTLVVVDADQGATIASLPIGKGTDAAAFDPKRKLIFSSNGEDGTLSIIREQDAQTFISVGTRATAVSARTMSIDPESGRLYIAAGVIADGAPTVGRRAIVPGSLKLLFLDPTS
jgi:YVTN family beta-propeller protein